MQSNLTAAQCAEIEGWAKYYAPHVPALLSSYREAMELLRESIGTGTHSVSCQMWMDQHNKQCYCKIAARRAAIAHYDGARAVEREDGEDEHVSL